MNIADEKMKIKPKKTFSWMSPKLELREVKYGMGVFSNTNIKKGESLAIFGGYILTLREEEKLTGEYNDTGMQISKDFVLSTKYEKEDTDCFNHSCDPNAGFNGQIFLVAMQDIKKNKEVTIDYAMVTYKSKNARSYRFNCLCGSKNCRKTITNNDWKSKILQKKYRGYFQYYLQKIIDDKKRK
jgi:uncharacterized protein